MRRRARFLLGGVKGHGKIFGARVRVCCRPYSLPAMVAAPSSAVPPCVPLTALLCHILPLVSASMPHPFSFLSPSCAPYSLCSSLLRVFLDCPLFHCLLLLLSVVIVVFVLIFFVLVDVVLILPILVFFSSYSSSNSFFYVMLIDVVQSS